MKTTTFALIGWMTLTFAQAQQGPPETSPPPKTSPAPTTAPPPVTMPDSPPPGSALNPTNPPPGRPFTTNLPPGFNPTNLPPGRPFTNRFFTNNLPGTNGTRTNAGVTAITNKNGVLSRDPNLLTPTSVTNLSSLTGAQDVTINFTITNTLATMSPAQSNNVIQVSSGLTTLQTLAVNLGGTQNFQLIIQQNPTVQQQLDQMANQIAALAQGQRRPSNEIVVRLSQDLFRAFGPAQLTADRTLVLALVLNQAMNSGNLTRAQLDDSINNALAALQTSGVPMAVAHPVTCDLHSIAFELQPGLAR